MAARKRSKAKPTASKKRSQAAKKGWATRERKAQARSEAAKKGWKTRAAHVRGEVERVMGKWGAALQEARDKGNPQDWRRLRRIDATRRRILDEANKTRRWRKIIEDMAEEAAETFDIEPDTLVQ